VTRPAVCAECGYGVEVRRVVILIDGRVKTEKPFCGRCLLRLLEKAGS
jgi:hypothetical protein